MDAVKLEFDVGTTNAEYKLGVKVTVDSNIIYNNTHVTTTDHISHDMSDQDGNHVLEIELYGKLPEHTEIDSAGNIVKDALITVENFKIDDLDISSMLTCYPNELYSDVPTHIIQYCHDFNGTQSAIIDRFHGSLGCNGTVTLKFTTPIYLWLLENM
jgi:hypothetical protein